MKTTRPSVGSDLKVMAAAFADRCVQIVPRAALQTLNNGGA